MHDSMTHDPTSIIATIPLATLRPAARTSEHRPPARWSVDDIETLYQMPFMDLLYRAQQVHREHFDANEIQLSTLLSIKTGGCPEDCGYCPQSAHYDTGLTRQPLMGVEETLAAAKQARDQGATRFCMGAAWRSVPDGNDFSQVLQMLRG